MRIRPKWTLVGQELEHTNGLRGKGGTIFDACTRLVYGQGAGNSQMRSQISEH